MKDMKYNNVLFIKICTMDLHKQSFR